MTAVLLMKFFSISRFVRNRTLWTKHFSFYDSSPATLPPPHPHSPIQAQEKKNAAANATEATNDNEDVDGTEENSENITENENNDEAPADEECNEIDQEIDQENDQTEIEAAS